MATDSSPNGSLEHFAQLRAALAAGSASRADVLAGSALDEAGWRHLCEHWLPRLAMVEVAELALSFTRAYGRASIGVDSVLPELPPSASASLVVEGEDTLVDAPVVVEATPDATLADAFPLAGPALPFSQGGFGARAMAAQAQRPLAAGPVISAELTLEVACQPLPASAALPFVGLAAHGTRQRLVRFDPATGQPLAVPRWVEESLPDSAG